MLVAVGIEDERALPVLLLKAVGVELGLLLADGRVSGGALGFDQRQRLAVVAPKDVIDVSLAGVVGHSADFNLEVPGRIECPARFLEQHINIGFAGFRFRVVMGVRLGGIGLPGRRDFLTQLPELVVQRGLVGEQRGQAFITRLQVGGQLLQLLQGLGGDSGCFGYQADLKAEAGFGTGGVAVGSGQPVAEVEEFAGGAEGVGRGHFPGAMDGQVAQVLDQAGLGEERIADGLAKGRFVNQGAEVVLIGRAERGVVFVEPRDG